MPSTIIDIPEAIMLLTEVNWQIDWRTQKDGADLQGGEQIVISRFPRFRGSFTMILHKQQVGFWRAKMAELRGRSRVARVVMFDPVGYDFRPLDDFNDFMLNRVIEDRPKVRLVSPALAGDTSITVDERLLKEPVRVGAYMSFNDWPFIVTSREGYGAAVVLGVQMLRVSMDTGSEIDVKARGLFRMDSDDSGSAAYGIGNMSAPAVTMTEWITR